MEFFYSLVKLHEQRQCLRNLCIESMTNAEEFEYWVEEYRENPAALESETETEILRMLDNMCARGNPNALEYAEQERRALQWKEAKNLERPLNTVGDNDAKETRTPGFPTQSASESDYQPDWVSESDCPRDWVSESDCPRDWVSESDYTRDLVSESDYTPDWDLIAQRKKDNQKWCCEVCGFRRAGSSLIQVHHIDHDKGNNDTLNLKVLCAICHGKQHGGFTPWPNGTTTEDKHELKRHQFKFHRLNSEQKAPYRREPTRGT